MQISKHTTIVLSIATIVSSGILFYTFYGDTNRKNNRLSAVLFRGINGWGYEILVNDSVFIHQASIPALGTGKGFDREEQARRAANLVLKKLESKDGLPTLSRFELEEICSSVK
ncbi:MAG: DUF4907 domain-containing protein [Chitinophagaceae bacterium]|nr:MAG: DUF4907 domain-containing protein [Chitinophagaceae bacterium]